MSLGVGKRDTWQGSSGVQVWMGVCVNGGVFMWICLHMCVGPWEAEKTLAGLDRLFPSSGPLVICVLLPSSSQTPMSVCSKDCQPGQREQLVGIHPLLLRVL